MGQESRLKTARIISVIAATFISLASGTNYVYSAWAPQFAEKLKLSSTQSNLIGTFANLGMYAGGIPVGMMVDHKGPRWGLVLGAILLATGYYPLKIAYDRGAGSMSMAALCIFSLFTGVGSCSGFSAALKTAALNYPHHRGTATAFPLSAFGLSAFFFSMISKFAFPDDTSRFLLMLATGTVSLVVVSFFFLRVVPRVSYSSLSTDDPEMEGSQVLHRTKSSDSKHARHISETPGAHDISHHPGPNDSSNSFSGPDHKDVGDEGLPEFRGSDTDETSSLLSKSDIGSKRGEMLSDRDHGSLYSDVRGVEMLRKVEFWQLFLLMGLLTGIGLMTINNIGNDVQALWRHYDDSASDRFINGRQLIHVSVLSFLSFVGRLCSGIGSDLLVKKLHASRIWCIFFSSIIFCVVQICAMKIENPHFLGVVSGLTGFGYGFLFGCFPSIVAHTFGVNVMSQNWGAMTIAPVVSGNIFNLVYGAIYDKHSIINPAGNRVAGLAVTLWSIWTEQRHWKSQSIGKDHNIHDRQA